MRPHDILLPPVTIQQRDQLRDFAALLEKAQPLKARHRSELPRTVRQLSVWLTSDRRDLPRDYMAQPRWLAAYLRYFLPWNLYRQVRLLRGLELELGDGAVIADLGAGPLTFLLALWIARPDLRRRRIEYVGVDRAEPALKAGRTLLAALAGKASMPWRVRTIRAVVGDRLSVRADLLVAANFLNELQARGEKTSGPDRGHGQPRDWAAAAVTRWRRLLRPGGRILLIEPGVRLAARRLYQLREAGIAGGFVPRAPCPHAGACPLPATRQSAWCHFNFDTAGAPAWLHDLSRRADLSKAKASLSCLLLAPRPDGGEAAGDARATDGRVDLRIISEAFDLPGGGTGQYACSRHGLVLVALDKAKRTAATGTTWKPPQADKRKGPPGGNQPLSPGDLVAVRWPDNPQRDAKSGAQIVRFEQ